MKLTGKKALITGGNSGIGLATARLFIAEGTQVAITGRDQKTLDAAIAELGPNARGYRADITVAEDRKQLFAALAKDFGKLDIVFANAGISGRTPTGSTDEAIFENVIRTNLNAAFFTVNSAAPLLNDNGSIIFNGSVLNYLGQAGMAAYAATKGGIVSMARSIAADLAPRNIHVRRSVVMMVQGTPKTEASAKDVPLDAALAESLLKLRPTSSYNRETDWVFASPTKKGKQPLWPDTLWRRYGKPAVKAAEIKKRVAFHTFRHTYTTLLTQNSEDVKVVQELLRHANSRVTLDLYAQAGMQEKREAQSKLVRLVLNKGEALA